MHRDRMLIEQDESLRRQGLVPLVLVVAMITTVAGVVIVVRSSMAPWCSDVAPLEGHPWHTVRLRFAGLIGQLAGAVAWWRKNTVETIVDAIRSAWEFEGSHDAAALRQQKRQSRQMQREPADQDRAARRDAAHQRQRHRPGHPGGDGQANNGPGMRDQPQTLPAGAFAQHLPLLRREEVLRLCAGGSGHGAYSTARYQNCSVAGRYLASRSS